MSSEDKVENDMSLHEFANFKNSEKINDIQMETLLKEMDEMRRTYKVDKDLLVLQLEEEWRNLEKEKEWCDEMEKRQQIIKWSWTKHCDVLLQVITEKEKMLEEVVDDMETLKSTVETLKEKARDMDPEELKAVGKRLKDDGPLQVKKLHKKNSTTTRQYFENEIKELELQVRGCKSQEVHSMHVINLLVDERNKLKRQLELDTKISGSFGNVEKKLRESKAREVSATNMINSLLKEREELMTNLLEEKERMVLELKTERKNMNKKNKERFKLLKRDREIIEELMLEKLSHLRTFQPDGQLPEQIGKKDNMKRTLQTENVQESIELQWRENKDSQDLEAFMNARDELRRIFQADIDSLVLQIEEERRKVEKETKWCDDMEKRHEILKTSWIKHCDVLVQGIVLKEEMLEEVMDDVDTLRGTVKDLEQKARDMDHEVMMKLKEVDKRLNNFGPQWFKKLHKEKNTKMRQDFEKEIKELKLQLRDYKSQEVCTTEVIDVMSKENTQLNIDVEDCQHICMTKKDVKKFLKESKSREALAAKVINSLVREMDEIKKNLLEEKKRMAIELNKERKNMEKETNKERFKFLKREREVIETFIAEKKNEQTTLQPDLQCRESKGKGAQMREKLEAMVKEMDEMRQTFKADKDCLVQQLKEEQRKMKEAQDRLKLQGRENEDREAQMREQMEAMVKERNEMRRAFQADKDCLVLRLEEEQRKMKKDQERFVLQYRKMIENVDAKMREKLKNMVKEGECLLLQLQEEQRKNQQRQQRTNEARMVEEAVVEES